MLPQCNPSLEEMRGQCQHLATRILCSTNSSFYALSQQSITPAGCVAAIKPRHYATGLHLLKPNLKL